MGLNRDDEAFDDLKHVPDDHPMAPAARLEMGQMELRRNRFAAAERYFLQALKLDPTLIQARRELVYIYGIQLRRADLNATFRLLSETSTLTYSEVFLWCLTRGVTWEPEEIVKTLARRSRPTRPTAGRASARRRAYLDMSRLDEAEATLAPLPESDPDARAIRVRMALARGDDQRAETLLDGGPDDHAGLALLRGQLALARGDAKAALHHFRIAYRKAPFLREAVFGLGKALQINGDPTAATYLDQALKLDLLGTLMQKAAVNANRADPDLIRDLGAACASVGRIPEARAWYNIAIDRDPLDIKATGLARQAPRPPRAARVEARVADLARSSASPPIVPPGSPRGGCLSADPSGSQPFCSALGGRPPCAADRSSSRTGGRAGTCPSTPSKPRRWPTPRGPTSSSRTWS